MEQKELFSRDYALERNTINIYGVIDTPMADLVMSELQYLDDKFKRDGVPQEERIITLQINSPGGSVTDGFAIYDTLNYVEAKIRTVGIGMCASMGAFLLSAGSYGMRSATANCEILIHQPLGGASGQASDIIIAADHIKRTRDRLNRILSENTGKPIKTIQKDTDRDYIMTADEAMSYGLIDRVIHSKNKAKE
ncbi:MAG: ClpP family protease [Candidatus Coproplasma sp.]